MSSEITNLIDYYIRQAESLLVQVRQLQAHFRAPGTEVAKDLLGEVVGKFGEVLLESPIGRRWGKLTKGYLTQQQKQQLALGEQRIENAFTGLVSNLNPFLSSISIKKPGLKPEGNSYLLLRRLARVQEAIRLETKIKKLIAILKAIRSEALIYNRDIPQLLEQEKVMMKDAMERKIKRGKESWGFIYLVFSLSVAIAIFFISILPIDWIYKIIIFVLFLIVVIWLCLFNAWSQNKIIGWKNKLEDSWRKI